jgi:NO-binding membrane sensor protein with MHYT domain
MTETAPSTADASLLLIALAAVLAVLTAHVTLGWLHEAQRRVGMPGPRAIALVVVALTLGSGLCAASVLVLAGEALTFPIGYHSREVLLLWAAAIGGSALIGFVLLSSVRWWAVSIAGVALGGLVLALHVGWVQAAGFRPGVTWEPVFMIAAGALIAAGCCSGLWLNWSDSGGAHVSRGPWRLGAAVLIGLSVVTGLELLDSGLALPSQIGSVYLRQLPGNVLSLLSGVLLPLVLSVMAIDLRMRRRQRRHMRRQGMGSAPSDKGHRSRHKFPTL